MKNIGEGGDWESKRRRDEEEGVRRRASKTERGRGGERARGGEGEPCRQSISVRTEKEGE